MKAMKPKTWTIKEILKVTTDYLKEKGIDTPRLDAEVLLARQLKMDRVGLYVNLDQPLSDAEIAGYRFLVKRRAGREPLQYITGIQEFWSLDFIVDPRVLIPRPESELLVEEAVNLCKNKLSSLDQPPMILDLGTGSGALAISLAIELPGVIVWGTDRSPGALEVAGINASRHGVSGRITFEQGDLWDPIVRCEISFDIIVSNPPYVALEEYGQLPPEVREFEPRAALDGGERGMHFIENIIRGAPDHLNRGGWLLLEMAPGQTRPALNIMEETGSYEEKRRLKDYSNVYRVVVARKRG